MKLFCVYRPCFGLLIYHLVIAKSDRQNASGQWRHRLKPLHQESFGNGDPLTPVRLEVLDQETQEAIERLVTAGLLAPTQRVVRPLFPLADDASQTPLTETERARIGVLREQAARKLKAACVLGEAGLVEEARSPLLAAILLHFRVLAATRRLPEPEDLTAALLPPLARHFGGDLQILRSFIEEVAGDWQSAARALSNGRGTNAGKLNRLGERLGRMARWYSPAQSAAAKYCHNPVFSTVMEDCKGTLNMRASSKKHPFIDREPV